MINEKQRLHDLYKNIWEHNTVAEIGVKNKQDSNDYDKKSENEYLSIDFYT